MADGRYREVKCCVCGVSGLSNDNSDEPICFKCNGTRSRLFKALPKAEELKKYQENDLNKFMGILNKKLKGMK